MVNHHPPLDHYPRTLSKRPKGEGEWEWEMKVWQIWKKKRKYPSWESHLDPSAFSSCRSPFALKTLETVCLKSDTELTMRNPMEPMWNGTTGGTAFWQDEEEIKTRKEEIREWPRWSKTTAEGNVGSSLTEWGLWETNRPSTFFLTIDTQWNS